MVQAVENRAEYHGDRDRKSRDFSAAGGSFGEFGIGLQLIVEAGCPARRAIGEIGKIGIVSGVGTIGIVRIAFDCHD